MHSRILIAALALCFALPLLLSGEEERPSWEYSVSAYAYIVPDDQNYGNAVVTADREWLHLEGRFNYEDIDTGSAWIGYNFSVGEKWALEVVPMIGGVFGATSGIAPGWELTLTRGKFELYSESEVVFDTSEFSNNFYYNWSEFTYAPTDWIRFGLALQRTKAYQTDLDVQRGVLVGASFGHVDVTCSVLNFGWETPTVILSAGASW